MHDMYIWLDTTAQAVTLGGIPFAAFYACAKPYIRNMLLLKSDYVGAHCCKNFELLCGQDEIKAFLASEDLRFGDFCFVDFADGANPDALTPEQVNVLHQDMYMSDFKTLVSLNRSNGGLTYFSEGYLISKWASRPVPDADELSQIYKSDETEILLGRTSTARLYFQGFKLFLFALMLLV